MERIINLIQKLNDKFENKKSELISSPLSCGDRKKEEYQKIIRGIDFALSSIPLDIDGDYLTAFNIVKNSIIKANLLNLQSNYLSVFYTKDIKYDKNHKTIYYSYSGIAIPYNGFHSITDGWLNRSNCIVKCLSTDEKDLFEHIFTDGSLWYNNVDGSVIEQVKDVQLAVHHYLVKLQANDFRKAE